MTDKASPRPDGYIRKGWIFREIAYPLSQIHADCGKSWAVCNCALAEILRKLDAAMLTKQKRKRKVGVR